MSSKTYINGEGVITVGDKTTTGGTVISGASNTVHKQVRQARKGDKVYCPKCNQTGSIIEGSNEYINGGRPVALNGHIVSCGCPSGTNRLIASSSSGDSEPIAEKAKVTDNENNQNDKKLKYKISLSGKNKNILTPLAVPDFSEKDSGTTQNKELITFIIENVQDDAEMLSLEIVDGTTSVYSERQTAQFLPRGKYEWSWDGYNKNGILDTNVLKSPNLLVKLVALQGDKTIVFNYKLKNSSKIDWVDILVDRNQKIVDIVLRPSVSDGGVKNGLENLKPKDYSELMEMVGMGIELYWSRNGNRISGIGSNIKTEKGNYNVNVKTKINSKPAMPTFKIISSLDGESHRSVSLKGFEKIYYQLGFFHEVDSVNYIAITDEKFKYDAAHEFGHVILNKYGADSTPDYSWSHKGTSEVIIQEPLPNTPMPKTGEIDLMKYSDDKFNPSDFYDRLTAAEEDVKGLIWLSRIEFND